MNYYFRYAFTKTLIYLNLLPKKTKVNLRTLAKHGLIKLSDGKKHGVKILGGGELKTALIIQLPCSKSAVKKIEKAGGKVEKGE